jgi:hypothetical protein
MTTQLKKISTNIPADLLKMACAVTSLNQTDALIAGLKELIAQQNRRSILDLRGRIKIDINLNEARKRTRL